MGKIATLVRDEAFRKLCNNAKTKASDIIRFIMEHERAEFMNETNE